MIEKSETETVNIQALGAKKTLASLMIAALVLVSIPGCNTTKQQTGTAAGGGVGAVLGALAGNQLGGTKGAVIGGLIGAAAGAMVGGEIGRYLDEQDRQKAALNTFDALEKSKQNQGKAVTTSWTSDKNQGVSGMATAEAVSEECYVVQEVAVIPGHGDVRQESRYCSQGGTWTQQSI